MRWKNLALFGAVFLSGCVSNPPVYDEGILTLDPVGFEQKVQECLLNPVEQSACIRVAWRKSIIGDFAASGGGTYAIFGESLDGFFLYSPASRSNILKWSQERCK